MKRGKSFWKSLNFPVSPRFVVWQSIACQTHSTCVAEAPVALLHPIHDIGRLHLEPVVMHPTNLCGGIRMLLCVDGGGHVRNAAARGRRGARTYR